MEESALTLLKEGGAIGLAALMILYSLWKDRMFAKITGNHLHHLNETMGKLANAVDKLADNEDRTKEIIDRVERVLDKRI